MDEKHPRQHLLCEKLSSSVPFIYIFVYIDFFYIKHIGPVVVTSSTKTQRKCRNENFYELYRALYTILRDFRAS
jgi:hypothetical protein